jgi:hypothetical protein
MTMITGRELAHWVADLRASGRVAPGAAVLRHGAALCDATTDLRDALAAVGDDTVTVFEDTQGIPVVPTAADWLFAHPDAVTGHDAACRVHIERDVSGAVRVHVQRGTDINVSVEGRFAVELVEAAGLVARLAAAGAALAAAGDEVAAGIERLASDASPSFRARYNGLQATDRFFTYAAALACFLSACERVAQRREPAIAVAAAELLAAQLVGPDTAAHGLDPAWAQAELAASYA